ncbi:MraY family glycosyltransferase [Chitinophaga rhizophila]|uniref:Glycosyltransferase family 4 protein n=1 Tax=Chitinophaga rhizophila TaxID=2866212 RepID=A0ABS7GJ70_9BACT|nr:glycosyltransferase family 4 protein [Chitinophaga rhizophila]MBW8687346.1 glycosyltransferase family 4 protein [Chitinophaga rhizophila]
MMYLVYAVMFFLLLIAYFKIADRYNIIDKPNERSSHANVTIRGGGIIFIIAALVAVGQHFTEFWLPVLGIVLIGVISFLDDIYTLPNKVRLLVHLVAVTLLFLYLHVLSLPLLVVIMLYILVIGIINAYNFMDGINGITGLYSLVVLGGLQFVNLQQAAFIAPDMIWLPMIASVVFLFFNFRRKAVCFAGDVGSVTIAFWIVLLLLDLILTTGDWLYILFLSVYGVDSILTIIHRLLLQQNIFKAHRLHFYQILANEQKVPHLVVSTGYALIQALIIILLINGQLALGQQWIKGLTILLPLVLIYVGLKGKLMQPRLK